MKCPKGRSREFPAASDSRIELFLWKVYEIMGCTAPLKSKPAKPRFSMKNRED